VAELGRLARMPKDKLSACDARLRELLRHEPPPTENTFVVGHYENLAAVGGPNIDEAGWAIFLPDKGNFRLVGRLNPDQWQEMARAAKD